MRILLILLLSLVVLAGCDAKTVIPDQSKVKVTCNDICSSHLYQTLGTNGDNKLTYQNMVCYCKSAEGKIFTFVM